MCISKVETFKEFLPKKQLKEEHIMEMQHKNMR
jgi:hypothetical protein